MAVEAGRKIFVEIDMNDDPEGTPNWTKIGQQRGGSGSGNTEMADATHKDDDGWKRGIVTRTGWSVSVDGALNPLDTVWLRLKERWKKKEKVWVRVNEQGIGGSQEYGEAWVSEFSREFPENDAVTFTVELEGDGPLLPLPV